MNVLSATVGIVLIGLVVLEVFNDLFHPPRSGAFSHWLGRRLFNLLRRTKSWLPVAGPVTILLTIASWTLTLMVGFALVYYGSFPESFRTSVGAVPREPHRFLASVYYSFQILTTLAFGDMVAQSTVLRLVSCLEGLIGFGVLTASVSSIVLVYPALSRLRMLARGVSHLVDAERRIGLRFVDSGSDIIPANLARDVTTTRIDLIHFPIIYFFGSDDPRATLAYALPYLSRLCADGQRPGLPAHLRLASSALDCSLDDLSRVLAGRFLHMDAADRDAVFRAVARDHAIEETS